MNEHRDQGSLRRQEAIVELVRSGTVRSQAEHAMPDDLPDAAVLQFFEKHDPNTIGSVDSFQ